MDVKTVLQELESLGTERTKKVYMRQGAREPLYGVATGRCNRRRFLSSAV
ncbi:hypothetical protein ACHOLT_17450 [Desulfitobacterium sp. Sab5]